MKENFFNSMLSDEGKISHKRWIAVTCSAVVCFMCTFATVKYPQYFPGTLQAILVFIAVISGVATVPQIITLVRGNPPAKEEEPKKPAEEADKQ